MKKKIMILLLVIIFPNIVLAATCDTKKHVQYQKLAEILITKNLIVNQLTNLQ